MPAIRRNERRGPGIERLAESGARVASVCGDLASGLDAVSALKLAAARGPGAGAARALFRHRRAEETHTKQKKRGPFMAECSSARLESSAPVPDRKAFGGREKRPGKEGRDRGFAKKRNCDLQMASSVGLSRLALVSAKITYPANASQENFLRNGSAGRIRFEPVNMKCRALKEGVQRRDDEETRK
jgi:hypothetical protein